METIIKIKTILTVLSCLVLFKGMGSTTLAKDDNIVYTRSFGLLDARNFQFFKRSIASFIVLLPGSSFNACWYETMACPAFFRW